MPENEFEKQVQHKMDEFRLRPSAPVWEKIKDDLNERKRRRFFFMISLLAAASLFGWMGYNYFFANNTNTIKDNQTETAAIKNNTTQSVNEDKPFNNQDTGTQLKHDSSPVNESVGAGSKEVAGKTNNTKELSTDFTGDKSTSSETVFTLKKQKQQDNKSRFYKQKIAKDVDDKIVSKTTEEKSSNPISKEGSNTEETEQENVKADRETIGHNIVTNNAGITPANFAKKDESPVQLEDFDAISFSANISGNTSPVVTIPAIAANAVPGFSHKIKWGISVSAGASSRAKEPFDFFSSASAEKALFDAAPPFQQGNITGGVLVLPPSDVKPGLAFKAGFIVEKSVSKKITVSSGLQYAYSSDRIRVGKSITASSGSLFADRSYYSALTSQNATAFPGNPTPEMTTYTNKYHFIELPVQLQYSINKKWKNPLIWNAGVAVSRLIASDALLYNVAYGGVYYDAKNDIRRTQFNVSTGFAFRFTVNKLQWSLGPQVSINTSKLFNNAYDNNVHPVYGGLNARLIFPGRKK